MCYVVTIFSFFKASSTGFHSGCSSVHFYQQQTSIHHPHIHLSIFNLLFFSLVVLTGVRLNLNVVLICISLTNNKDQLLWKSLRHFYFFPWFWEVNLRACLKFKFNWLIYFLGISLYVHHMFIYSICYMFYMYVICYMYILDTNPQNYKW